MNIDWVIPCRYAEVHDNLGTIIGAGIDTWWLATLPAPVQVSLAVRLLATSDELGAEHEHTVRNIVRSPLGEIVSELASPFAAGGGEGARTEWLNGIIVLTVVAFQAETDGTYTFEHTVDGSSKQIPLHIVHGLPPGVPQSPSE